MPHGMPCGGKWQNEGADNGRVCRTECFANVRCCVHRMMAICVWPAVVQSLVLMYVRSWERFCGPQLQLVEYGGVDPCEVRRS